MKKLSYLILILLILQLTMPTNVISQNSEKKTYYILYDEAHGQFFNHHLLDTALKSLNSSLNLNIKLIINKDKFNSTNLQTADLVIITNPGFANKSTHALINIGSSETTALNSFISLGGSILYMLNPYSTNSSISGHSLPMTSLLVSALTSLIFKTPSNDNDNVSIVMDDFHNDGNSSHVKINLNNINDKTIYNEKNNLTSNSIYYYGTNFNVNPANNSFVGKTAYTSYAVDQNYVAFGDSLNVGLDWLYGTSSGNNNGRTMVVGSTIMFSNLKYNNNTTWINSNNDVNLKLFQNIIAWLFKITPLPAPQPLVSQNLNFFYFSNLISAIAGALILIILVYSSLIFKGRISADKLFSIRIAKRGVSKPKSISKKQTTNTSKKSSGKKKSRSERRK